MILRPNCARLSLKVVADGPIETKTVLYTRLLHQFYYCTSTMSLQCNVYYKGSGRSFYEVACADFASRVL